MHYPSEQEFLKLTKKGNLIPVCREISGDLETPVSAYYKVAGKARYSFLLESVEGEEKIARFSFLAKDPELVFQTKGNRVKMIRFPNKRKKTISADMEKNPLSHIRRILKDYRFVSIKGLPRFCGGLVGYLSYDLVRFFERIPDNTNDDLNLPDTMLMLAKDLIIFDHINHKMKIVSCAYIRPKANREAKLRMYKKAVKSIDQLVKAIEQPLKVPQNRNKKGKGRSARLKVKSNFTKPRFKRIIQQAKKDIRNGEIIQVVLSQRFQVGIETDPFNIYRSLRVLNPSPYMYFLNFDGVHVIGSSPELLVRCEENVVETRPIAGTRPRGKNEREDQRLSEDLLNDEKEKAEHIMLVDLGRNDLGRVSKEGSVRLSEFMQIEKYSHVMHIVSNVKGDLLPGKDDLDVLQAAFPAGTVSGAPKIRAMEIIEELERVKRGPYAGCIGYFSFSGNLDTCITIRTIIVKGDQAYVQAGAGIVADSNPEKEYHETMNKAKAQILAIKEAHHN